MPGLSYLIPRTQGHPASLDGESRVPSIAMQGTTATESGDREAPRSGICGERHRLATSATSAKRVGPISGGKAVAHRVVWRSGRV
jgi:hypothetical protein